MSAKKRHTKHSLRPRPVVVAKLVNVYVWEWPVRVTHWLTAGSIWVLSVTGLYLGYPFIIVPGEAGQHFVMGTAKLIHNYAAIVFTLAVLSRIVWMFIGNWYSRWHRFIPTNRGRWRGMKKTLEYYLFALRLPPGFVGHNPLAGLTYLFVFGAYLVQIATGLAMYSASAHLGSPMRVFSFLVPWVGGLSTAHYIHHVVMWLIWCFVVHHIYSAILMSQVEATATVESIFSGHKFLPPEHVTHPGYRYERGEA